MPKTDGYKTRQKILQEAEDLFSEKGFNGTSIDMIAKAAGINKGLIYYHFKNKHDIMLSIFQTVISELEDMVMRPSVSSDSAELTESLQEKIRTEIEYLRNRKKIITLLLMEGIKSGGNSDFLFQCAEIVARIEHQLGGKTKVKTQDNGQDTHYLLHEFFTGFIPVVTFIAMQDKWCSYFNCTKEEAFEYFIESFTRTHLKEHL